MISTSSIDSVSSYLPALMLRRFARDPRLPSEPTVEHCSGAVLFADMSGFTALTETLAEQGAAGAEQLTQIINDYFSKLIGVIHAHGGDVVKFAGDALVAVWLTSETVTFKNYAHTHVSIQSASDDFNSESLVTVTHRAAQCGLAIQETFQDYQIYNHITLSLHVSIGAGEIVLLHLGGVFGRWELLVTGNPLVQVGLADKQAKPAEVLLSPQAWQLLHDQGQVVPCQGGFVRLITIKPLPLRCLQWPTLPPAAQSVLWSCIPRAVLNRLREGQSQWLAELRCLTILFINLPDLNEKTQPHLAQQGMQILQKSLYHYEGSINKLNVDDKGTTLIAALGLPPLSHEDDALRGAQAALTIQKRLQEISWQCAIGVATGRVFCGAVGSLSRREYTMLGDTVNLAARLMQSAPKNILCDATTYRATLNDMRYERLPDLRVKGKADLVAIYRPYALKALNAPRRQATLIGRVDESACLASQLQRLQTNQSSVIIIEGEAGIGKSRLVSNLLTQAQQAHIFHLLGSGDSIEKSTPYYAWRPVLSQLFDVATAEEIRIVQCEHILNRLYELKEFRRAPLLNTLLPLNLPDNIFTLPLRGAKRIEQTLDLLISLLKATVEREDRVLLALEDAQWLDPASWKLLSRLQREVHPLLLVLAIRPVNDSLPDDFQQLYYHPHTHILPLDNLSPEETIALVCQRLGVQNLPDPVSKLIQDKAQGHPLFSEELAYALRDNGLLQIRQGQCQLTSDQELSTFTFPETIQGMIASRLDRLTPEQQLTLKIASVIGTVFPLALLQVIYPIVEEKPLLPGYLATLQRLGIIATKTPPPDLTYQFNHVIVQEVAYNLMLFSQRRELHHQVATWYENTYQDNLVACYPLLAYHWSKAEVPNKAVEYAEKAGQQASYKHASLEVVHFFNQALNLSQTTACLQPNSNTTISNRIEIDSQRQAQWEQQLGEAYTELGRLSRGRQHLKRTLSLLGYPLPKTRIQLLLAIARQSLWGWWHSSGYFSRFRQENRGNCRQLADIYERIAHIAYYNQSIGTFIYAGLNSLSLAHRCASPTMLARAYANRCLASTLISLPGATYYSRRAQNLIKVLEASENNPNDKKALEKKGDLIWVYQIIGIHYLIVGKLNHSRLTLQRAITIAQLVEDNRRWEESLSHFSLLIYHQGHFQESMQCCEEIYVIAKRRGDIQAQQWGLCGQAVNYLRLGKLDSANQSLESAYQLSLEELIITEQIWLHGLLAVVRWQQVDTQSALEEARRAARWIAKSVPMNIRCLEGYASVAEVYLRFWETTLIQLQEEVVTSPFSNSLARANMAKQNAQQACQALHRYAKTFVIARPRAWLWQGLYNWLAGKQRRAYRAWQKSLTIAQQLNLPYEQALIHEEIGRHIELPHQAKHQQQAQALFQKLGITVRHDNHF